MKIELSETEIIHIMDSLRVRITDLRGEVAQWDGAESADLADELEELEHDLFEASARPGEWNDPEDPDLLMDQIVICDAEINAETQMFNAGVKAREKMKASSRAADRRTLKFVPPGPLGAKGDRPAPQPTDRSETQDVDVWAKPSNDPADW